MITGTLSRPDLTAEIQRQLALSPIVVLLGPRQCGKSTLARGLQPDPRNYFDLESLPSRLRLEAGAHSTLQALQGLVVIDEVQEMPELFPTLRVLADRADNRARFLLLGSAAPTLFRQVGETLAGRARFIEMGGFTVAETGFVNLPRLWLRGSFPRAYLHEEEADSLDWRRDFIRTFLVRDVPHWSEVRQDERTLYRFLEWAAQYHGQSWNHSLVGAQLGLSYKTVQRLVDIFTECFVLRQLPSYSRNSGARLRKAPKLYFRDAGLYHHFAGIDRPDALRINPRSGASWEGFALDQLIRTLRLPEERCFHWGKHSGAEVDLVIERGGKLHGVEFKLADEPRITPSMRAGQVELSLASLWVVTPSSERIELENGITAVGLNRIEEIGVALNT